MFGVFFLLLGIKSAMKLGQNQKKKKKGSILELLKFSIKIFILSLISHYMLYFMLVYRLMCFADNCILKIDK